MLRGMERMKKLVESFLVASAVFCSAALAAPAATEAPCADSNPLRQPFFGDLHVHSSYSFDSYVSSQRNTPWDAYRFGKGEAISLPDFDGKQTRRVTLERPLDFMAVTDHAEFLGPIKICTSDPFTLGYWFPACIATRSQIYIAQLLAADYWSKIGVADTSLNKAKSFVCKLADCDKAELEAWRDEQQAAEAHYDRSEACSFTTFVGYEYTDAPNYSNLHRNVIFRNENVIDRPISAYDTGAYNFQNLWQHLREECWNSDSGCDVMTIPHNSNLAGGLMFPDPRNEQEAIDRLAFEPVVELVQHKGASECRFDRLLGRGVGTEDELCDFEQIKADNLAMLGSVGGEVQTERGASVGVDSFGQRNMVRNALKAGVSYQQKEGINPFKMGFIGSTDTHSAMPGATEEASYEGHLGRRDAGSRNVQDHFFSNAGGLAVVWAEENRRDAIFDGIRRKEAYATSGTRPVVRFFGGWQLDESLCESADMVAKAYQQGVPMGGDLSAAPGSGAPRFLVAATKDPGTPRNPGNDLQRIQIIKGWSDANGVAHEQVFEVAGNPHNGATVDPQSCAPKGEGYANLCKVWQDPGFDAEQNAFYYARVVENPSCRWSTLQCKKFGVDPFASNCQAQAAAATKLAKDDGAWGEDVFGKCCLSEADEPFYSPVIQERAWTSPIWYSAATAE